MSPLVKLPYLIATAVLAAVPFPAFAQQQPSAPSFIQPEDEKDGADHLNEGRAITLTPEMIQNFAADLGLAPDSPRLQQILNAYYNPQADLNLAVNSDLDQEPETPTQVIRHIRGTEGIPFPTKDEVLLPFKITEEAVKSSLDSYFKLTEETALKNLKVPELPSCKEDKTERTATGYELPEKFDQVLVDLLFIKKNEIPVDYKEIFGKTVVLRPYSTSEPNVDSLSSLGIGVTCLPSRYRVTRGFIMRDEGKNALRNYEADPHGDGEYHEYMKAKLRVP